MKTATRYGWVQASLLAVLVCLTGMAVAQNPPPQQGSQPRPSQPTGGQPQGSQPKAGQQIFKPEQLDQMLAPVALYPDALLSQILMATTYPGDVAEAASWSAANPKAQGDAAVKQVQDKPWDPSVQSLVAFPQVLAQMKERSDWVQNVGDAFLAEPDQVMASIQRLRAKAQQAGNLKSNEQQKVIVQQAPPAQAAPAAAPSTTIIQIEPTNPEVVYVPSYNPTVVYGSWAYPGYPPYYWPPPAAYYPYGGALAAGLMFGAGIAITNSLWGGMNWGGGDVNINTNRYNNINRESNRISGNGNGNSRWNHNAENRRGTPYRDSGSRDRYGQGVGGAENRQGYRGREGAAGGDRQRAMQSFDRTTNNGSSAAARRGANGGAAGPAGAAPSDRMAGSAGAGRGGQGAGGFGDRNAGAGNAAGNRMGGQGGGDRGAGGNYGQRNGGGGSQARNNAFGGVQSPGSSRTQSNRGQSSQRSMGSSRSAGGGGGRQVSRPSPSRGGGGGRRRLGA
ncbi:DUF3300 domain-containing protein [Dyella sp. Tek66A03]|uniref:DUF3300 domain-containing protein n=1 Tax=Dyella sp. Tek66A03 TaxID=3458298 RepID=UPI00403EC79B